jgi:hypothetical protein
MAEDRIAKKRSDILIALLTVKVQKVFSRKSLFKDAEKLHYAA